MKRLIIILLGLMLGNSFLNAQTINNVPIRDIDVEYIKIVGTYDATKMISIKFDFGENVEIFNKKGIEIKDRFGRVVEFNSMIDALNFMSNNGYKFKNAYAISIHSVSMHHYILQKRQE